MVRSRAAKPAATAPTQNPCEGTQRVRRPWSPSLDTLPTFADNQAQSNTAKAATEKSTRAEAAREVGSQTASPTRKTPAEVLSRAALVNGTYGPYRTVPGSQRRKFTVTRTANRPAHAPGPLGLSGPCQAANEGGNTGYLRSSLCRDGRSVLTAGRAVQEEPCSNNWIKSKRGRRPAW